MYHLYTRGQKVTALSMHWFQILLIVHTFPLAFSLIAKMV